MNPHLWQVASSHGWGFSWLSKAAPGPTAEPRLVDTGLGQGGKSILPPSSAPINSESAALGSLACGTRTGAQLLRMPLQDP